MLALDHSGLFRSSWSAWEHLRPQPVLHRLCGTQTRCATNQTNVGCMKERFLQNFKSIIKYKIDSLKSIIICLNLKLGIIFNFVLFHSCDFFSLSVNWWSTQVIPNELCIFHLLILLLLLLLYVDHSISIIFLLRCSWNINKGCWSNSSVNRHLSCMFLIWFASLTVRSNSWI